MSTTSYPGYATTKETTAAQVFLRLIGADGTDPDLIAAVVAWVRAGGGPASNPLRLTSRGKLLHFSSLTAAMKLYAHHLLIGKETGGFGLIVRSFRNGHANEALVAIAMSSWDKNHYGLDKNGLPDAHLLLAAYSHIKSVKFAPKPTPKVYFTKSPQPTRYLEPPAPMYLFTSARAAIDAYAESRPRPQSNDFGGIMTTWHARPSTP